MVVVILLALGWVEGAVKKDKINVHLVPHTHDDVGWLKTMDQYKGYYVYIQLTTVSNMLGCSIYWTVWWQSWLLMRIGNSSMLR